LGGFQHVQQPVFINNPVIIYAAYPAYAQLDRDIERFVVGMAQARLWLDMV